MTSMKRRDFLKTSVALAVAAELGTGKAKAFVPAHNWAKYDFGSGPPVTDRLNQGPFSQYPPDAVIPTDEVVMTTTPSEEVVPNYGKGLITYITADMGTDEIKSDNVSQSIEDLVRFPLGQQLYVRPTWREVQPRPGRLEMPDYLKLVFDLSDNVSQSIEDLVRFPLGQQLYVRPTWREVQPRPGRLEMPDYLKLVFD